MKAKIVLEIKEGSVHSVHTSDDVEIVVFDLDKEPSKYEDFKKEVEGLKHLIGE